MAKIYVSQSSIRPIRWLLRLVGWCSIISGFIVLFGGNTDLLIYMPLGDSPAGSIGMGAFLVGLDLLLPDPYRKQRREKKKMERVYRQVYQTLPFGEGLKLLLKEYRRADLVKQVTSSVPFCRSILNQYPCRQVLDFIHTCHPEAAYILCAERLDNPGSTTIRSEDISARTAASGAGATPGHQQASAANASRIADLNALLAERKKETPRGTPLKKENIQLGPMLDQFYHGCDYYDAAGHRVMKYICIPDGPQGFGPIKVPEEIETLEQLMPWLVENHDFHLKK